MRCPPSVTNWSLGAGDLLELFLVRSEESRSLLGCFGEEVADRGKVGKKFTNPELVRISLSGGEIWKRFLELENGMAAL